MAADPTTPYSGKIPFSGELKDGLVLMVSTIMSDYSGRHFVFAVYYKNNWTLSESLFSVSANHTGIMLTSVEMKDGYITFTGLSNLPFDYAIVLQTDDVPTTERGG